MKNLTIQLNKIDRSPHDFFYNILLTIILAFAVIWLIYTSVPYSTYKLYLLNK